MSTYGRYGIAEDPTRCVETVYSGGAAFDRGHQCKMKRGFGPDGAHCRQHDPAAVAARRSASEKRWQDRFEMQAAPYRKAEKHDLALLEIAKHLTPGNENVTRGDLVACIRDLAQVAQSSRDTVEELLVREGKRGTEV